MCLVVLVGLYVCLSFFLSITNFTQNEKIIYCDEILMEGSGMVNETSD